MDALILPRVPLDERTVEDLLPEIKMLALEFEGVLGDGRVWTDAEGRQSVATWRADEMALADWLAAGRELVILARDGLAAAEAVAHRLGAKFRTHQVNNKGQALKMAIFDQQLKPGQVAYIGREVDDLPPMVVAGLAVAVPEAPEWVAGAAKLVLDEPGGRGALRQMVGLLLKDHLPEPV